MAAGETEDSNNANRSNNDGCEQNQSHLRAMPWNIGLIVMLFFTLHALIRKEKAAQRR